MPESVFLQVEISRKSIMKKRIKCSYKLPSTIPKSGQWTERLWLVVFVLLVAGDPVQVGAVLLHLLCEGLLRATELSGDGAIGDALWVILPELNDGIGLWIKNAQSGKELLQQHTVSDDFLHRFATVRDIVAKGTVVIRERLIQRRDVACRVIFTADAVAVTFPNESVGAHAPAVILFLVADAVGFLIKRIVLRLCDRHLLAGAVNVDKIGFLIVVVFHKDFPPFDLHGMEETL